MTFTGLIDSFVQPLERTRTEIRRIDPDRLVVSLDGFRPVDGATVRAVRRTPEVARAQAQDVLSVKLRHGRSALDGQLTLLDLGTAGWRPSLREGRLGAGTPGIVHRARRRPPISGSGSATRSRSATRSWRGRDGCGSSPRASASTASTAARCDRTPTPRSATWGRRTGLTGLANQVVAVPAPGVSRDAVVRALFGRPGVASVERAAAPLDAFDKGIDRFLWFIYATEAFVLLLALLVAFNSAAINADERRREHATMFAYGVPRRTVLVQSVAENGIVGLLASVVGLGIGLLVVGWIVRSTIPQTVPDLELSVFVSPTTVLAAVAIGVLACALAPLLTSRRLRRMDVASTLRVME